MIPLHCKGLRLMDSEDEGRAVVQRWEMWRKPSPTVLVGFLWNCSWRILLSEGWCMNAYFLCEVEKLDSVLPMKHDGDLGEKRVAAAFLSFSFSLPQSNLTSEPGFTSCCSRVAATAPCSLLPCLYPATPISSQFSFWPLVPGSVGFSGLS